MVGSTTCFGSEIFALNSLPHCLRSMFFLMVSVHIAKLVDASYMDKWFKFKIHFFRSSRYVGSKKLNMERKKEKRLIFLFNLANGE